jgi:DNA-binding response OmpR family regulator
MQRHGNIALKSTLENALAHSHRELSANALEALVSRLRKALHNANAGLAIHRIRGVGYRLTSENQK